MTKIEASRAMKTPQGQQGFTLIELLIVIAIIGLLATLGLTYIMGSRDEAYLGVAEQRLKEIHFHLAAYERRKGKLPAESGPEFLLAVWGGSGVEKSANNAKLWFCPSLGDEEVTDETVDEDITPETIHWTGRNQAEKKYKLRRSNMKGASKTIIASNKSVFANTMPHAGKFLAVLYLNGATGSFERADWGDDWGAEEPLIVGPDSPIEALHGLVETDDQ
jgi:prepilin-type N-terminal cleavage/methylation domain-containing protein